MTEETPSTDYYEILGVSKDAVSEDIRSSYKKLSLKYHPDKNPKGGAMFTQINRAHEILSNPDKRAVYDKYGEQGIQIAETGNFAFSSDSVILRWTKIIICYLLFILADYLFQMHLEWIAVICLHIYIVYLYRKQVFQALIPVAIADVVLYFLLPTDWVPFIASGMLYADALLFGNLIKTLWDVSLLLWFGLMGLDYYFGRYYVYWTFFGIHSIGWSSIFIVMMFVVFNSQPIPDLIPSYLTRLIFFALSTRIGQAVFLELSVWSLVFFLDYVFQISFEWIPLVLVALFTIVKWPLLPVGIAILGIIVSYFIFPIRWIMFCANAELHICCFCILSFWDISESEVKRRGFLEVINEAPKTHLLVVMFVAYADFHWRTRPESYMVLGTISAVWGIILLMSMVLGEIAHRLDVYEEQEKENREQNENADENANENENRNGDQQENKEVLVDDPM